MDPEVFREERLPHRREPHDHRDGEEPDVVEDHEEPVDAQLVRPSRRLPNFVNFLS